MKLSVALYALLIGRSVVPSTEQAGAWFTSNTIIPSVAS
jgi:hypothetical protein